MNFLTPLAFVLTALLPIIVALYFLKLRREERLVSSVYLWQEMVRDVAANAPWQQLRPNWLLLLQLLFLIALIVALARPFSWTTVAAGDHLILVVDSSASMAAADVEPNRLEVATDQARRLAAELPDSVPVTLIAAGDEARVLLSGSRDRGRLSQALDELRAGPGNADLATALELAAAVAAPPSIPPIGGEGGAAQIVVLSDGGVTLPDRVSSSAEVRYVPVGQSEENQAISALSLDPGVVGQGLAAFVRVANFSRQETARRLTIYADARLIAVRDLTIPGGDSVALTFPDLPPETNTLEARLEGQDYLPLDDQAQAVAPRVSGAQIQIVGPGNRFLETALSLLPDVEVTTISLEDYETTQDDQSPSPQTNWLTIFDTVLPEEDHYPPGALLFVGPLRSTEFFSVTGEVESPIPRPASASEPLLHYVDLQQVVVQRAARLPLPAWGRPVIVAAGGADGEATTPLLVAGETEEHRLAVLAFDLRQSDLPLQVAFPLLLANLVDFLAPGASGALPETIAPGRPLAIPLSPQIESASVTRPDGTSERLSVSGGEALFSDTDAPGVYEVVGETEGERWLLGRFAVNGFSPLESDIAPRERLELAGTESQAIAADRPARQEWWRPLAWIGLALLVAEWLVQYRGALARLWAGARVYTGLLLLLSPVIPSDQREACPELVEGSRNLPLELRLPLQVEIPRLAALARNDAPYISFSNPSALWALLIFLPLLALPFVGRNDRPTLRRWLGVALRLLIGLGLILGLAGAQLVRPVDDLTVVFLLDLSDSVPAAEQERAKAFIRQAVAGMPSGDRAAIVAFGEDALVERLASEERDLPPVASAPRPGRTDVAAAIRLGLALFPEESQKRLVLLSDGLENVGEALAQADLAAARGVEIAVAPLLAPPAEQEAYLAELEIPATVRQGQAFATTAVIESTLAQEATLYLLGDGRLLASKTVSLQPGTNRVQLSLTATETGFHRYRAELLPALDTLPQNNLASGFVVVYGPPRVLIVSEEASDVDALRRALASTGAGVDVVAPAMLPSELAILSGYDAVVLAGVPAGALPDGAMEALPVYVRELGRGLVMLGGEQGFGAGGYLRTPLEEALPVDMDVRSRTKEPNVALVLAVDKSGSMGRCHCDDPTALPGEYERVETGLPKVDIAKDAIVKASNVLGPLDYLGVVAFDENALWALQLQQLVAAAVLQNAVGAIQAEGQTNIWAGLTQAEEALLETEARVKHIILLTDGWSRSGDYAELTARLAEEGITLSVVAAGSGSAEYLRGLAEAGGGRYYPAPTLRDLPQIFLKETIKTVGSYIIEEPLYPLPSGATPILRGLDPLALPALLGYNGTTPKSTAQVALVSPRGDPLLAQWQYGLGRSVAWTSDLKGRWATDWLAWERFNGFAAQLVGWTLPEPADERVQVSLKLDGAEVRVQVDSLDENNRPRDLLETKATLIGPELSQQTVKLEQTAAGRYEGSALVGDPGAYLVQIVQRDGEGQPVAQQMGGLVVPYSPEYKRTGEGGTLLNELVRATGGSALETPDAAFAPTRQPASRARPLWPSLLLLAALLFPLDVAVRRLQLTPSDWRRLAAWAHERLPRRKSERRIGEPVLLGDLFQARERARRRGARPIERSERAPSAADPSPEPPPIEPAAPSPDDDTLSRLRQARDRVRRRR